MRRVVFSPIHYPPNIIHPPGTARGRYQLCTPRIPPIGCRTLDTWAFLFDCVDYRPLFTLDRCSLARWLRIHLFSSTQRLSRTLLDFPSYLRACLLLIHSGSQSLYFWAITIVIVSRGSFLPPQLLTHSASDDDTNNDGVNSVLTYPIRFVFTSVIVSSPCLANFVFPPRFSKELQTNLSNRSISVISFCSALILFLLHMFLPRLFDVFVSVRARVFTTLAKFLFDCSIYAPNSSKPLILNYYFVSSNCRQI